MGAHVEKVRLLYKTILRLHRGLPQDLCELGTRYTRDEFQRHKKCGEKEAQIFLTEWSVYALSLAKQLGLRGPQTSTGPVGASLSELDLEHFRDEQIVQLYELMQAAQNKTDDESK